MHTEAQHTSHIHERTFLKRLYCVCADNLNISVVSVDGIGLGKCSADLRQFPADECRTFLVTFPSLQCLSYTRVKNVWAHYVCHILI